MAEKMKIVIVSGNAFQEDYGGVLEHVRYLLPHLAEFKDLQISFLTFGNENVSYNKNKINYIILKRKFNKIFYFFELLYDIKRIKNIINKIDPDIIHLQSTIPLFSLCGILLKKKYHILITVHGYLSEEFKLYSGVIKLFYRFFCVPIERVALVKIPNIIVLSPKFETMIHRITNSKIYIIPNGIDLNYVKKIDSYKKKEFPTVFFLGYINKGKGLEDLVKALQLVKKNVNNVKLYIGGIGPYSNKLKKIILNLNIEKDVIFLGFLNTEEKYAYLKSMDVVVLPSYWESLPMVLLESMACGKPIIATDVGGISSIITDGVNGFLIKPGDFKLLAEKILFLIEDKERIEKICINNMKKAQRYDWNIIAQQTRNAYLELDPK